VNYRHGYHAGNHTEVFKHAALITLVELLKRKDKPFMVLDSHAGTGLYDLRAEMAVRTGEAEDGIRRVLGSSEPALQPYLGLVKAVGGPEVTTYPGSPEILRRLLRDGDRLVACELHPEDAAALRRNFSRDSRVAIHHRDGYEAVPALVPPPERRGLVFIDPPFERIDEAAALGRCLSEALTKWPTGSFAGWFPIKDDRIRRELAASVPAAARGKALLATFLRHPPDGKRLAGSGLLLLNPPWTVEARLEALLVALTRVFSGARWSIRWLAAADGEGRKAAGRA
jgi:23S rRNA (adenine2030-N6)-methyltransferase